MPRISPIAKRALALVAGALLLAGCTEASQGEGRSASGVESRAGSAGSKRGGPWKKAACSLDLEIVRRIRRDYFPGRSPELIALPEEPNYYGSAIGTSHSGPWDYIQEIPIVLYGPGYFQEQGQISLEREVTIADVAPTLAELLGMPWPEDRPGRSITEAIVPAEERSGAPKLIVVVVWDGGGTNVLRRWRGRWPNVQTLMRGGTSVIDAIVGSSPSNTPAAHTNLGTGAFPNQHGIVDLKIRNGDKIVDPFDEKSPQYLQTTTIGDLWDLHTDNAAEVGMFGYSPWHLGMLGYGSYSAGGDKDVMAIVHNSGENIVGSKYYEFPSYVDGYPGLDADIRTVDLEDGELDQLWLGNDVFGNAFDLKHSPAFILYQTRLVKAMLDREGFGDDDVTDLFFVNYKPLDTIGHKYNMVADELGSAVEYSDAELGKLRSYLDRTVGQGEWAMVMTADHGQTPAASTNDAFPINMDETLKDAAERFGMTEDEMFQDARVGHYWLDLDALKAKKVTVEDIADYFVGYTIADNSGGEVAEGYSERADERIFAAAWPSTRTDEIWECVSPS